MVKYGKKYGEIWRNMEKYGKKYVKMVKNMKKYGRIWQNIFYHISPYFYNIVKIW